MQGVNFSRRVTLQEGQITIRLQRGCRSNRAAYGQPLPIIKTNDLKKDIDTWF